MSRREPADAECRRAEPPATPHADAAAPAYLAPYRDEIERSGAGFSATLWGSREAQQRRFEVMHALVPLHARRVVDLGCGEGDLLAHLLTMGVRPASYLGLDAMAPMLERARQRGLPGARFEVADLLRDAEAIPAAAPDVACMSGILNTMEPAEARDLVGRALEASRIGVVFNFLSDRPHRRWSDRPLGPARRFDTLDWLDWALGRSSRVLFDQSYLDGHDATIAILRDS
jgi:SAM-dependent methyltransferase